MDTLIEMLIRLLWWPYEAWKGTTENSRVGTSPHEEETMKFWLCFAVAGTCIVGLAAAAIWFFFR